jgi:hypothetical protein
MRSDLKAIAMLNGLQMDHSVSLYSGELIRLLGSLKDVISRLEQQKSAIDKALAALHEFEEGGETESGAHTSTRPAKAVKKATKKRHISEEGRKRIADAARKRWAAVKKAKKAA